MVNQMSKITVIIGPPCAGKSTYAKDNAKDGDVVVDYDLIAQALGAKKPHESHGSVRELALTVRWVVVDRIIEGIDADSWIIHTAPGKNLIDQYVNAGAVFKLVEPSMDTCIERAINDGRPEGTEEAIRNWYDSRDELVAMIAQASQKSLSESISRLLKAVS